VKTTDRPALLDMDEMLDSGPTRRQLDYWSTKHYLRPDTASPGSGYKRRWPAAEQDIARLMVRLINAGLAVEVAAAAARNRVERGLTEIAIADGIILWLPETA
jgi:hypothetical protein